MSSTPNALADLYADRIGHVCRKRETEVFFLSVEAYRESSSPGFGSTGRAYVHYYVDADNLRGAEQRMLELLREHGWRPHRLEGWEIMSPERADTTLTDGSAPSQLELVEEALEKEHALAVFECDFEAIDAFEEEESRVECGR